MPIRVITKTELDQVNAIVTGIHGEIDVSIDELDGRAYEGKSAMDALNAKLEVLRYEFERGILNYQAVKSGNFYCHGVSPKPTGAKS